MFWKNLNDVDNLRWKVCINPIMDQDHAIPKFLMRMLLICVSLTTNLDDFTYLSVTGSSSEHFKLNQPWDFGNYGILQTHLHSLVVIQTTSCKPNVILAMHYVTSLSGGVAMCRCRNTCHLGWMSKQCLKNSLKLVK